jgi:hypothetical protein
MEGNTRKWAMIEGKEKWEGREICHLYNEMRLDG